MKIPFNKPFLTGDELKYIQDAVLRGKISGDGSFTKKCHQFFEDKYGFKKVLLTTSCTDALEMAAILIDTRPGDEIIVPAYTFVSTANAFVLRGAKIVFADSYYNNPNIDPDQIEALITPRTKAIVAVHYAGIACDMEVIMQIARKHGLLVIEDAAQAIDSFYKGKPLGSLGDIAAFSFHETKNIIAGEGGMITINNEKFVERAEIIREKGTNRSKFFRGEIDKYSWVDIGSSFLPSDIIAAFLFAQLEHLDNIQTVRKRIWQNYYAGLKILADNSRIGLTDIPEYATNNGHLFYLTCKSLEERTRLISYLNEKNINAVFHYLSLPDSPFYHEKHDGRELTNSKRFSDCLLRLPFYYNLSEPEQAYVIDSVTQFFK
jgi:dTDP-4-amino-4,6-dideoxygalactose transaminase